MTEERIDTTSGTKGNLPQSPTGGTWDAEAYNTNFAFVWEFATDLLSVLKPAQGEKILDIGCGTGQLTSAIAEAGSAVTGIDSDEAMVNLARQNFPGVGFEVMDAREMTYDNELRRRVFQRFPTLDAPPYARSIGDESSAEARRQTRCRAWRARQHKDNRRRHTKVYR